MKINEKKMLKELARNYVNSFEKIVDKYNNEVSDYDFANEEKLLSNYKKINKQIFYRKKAIPFACILVTIIVLTGCYKPISKFFIEVFEKFARIETVTKDTPAFDFEEVEFGFIPEGFELVKTVADYKIMFYDFLNEETNSTFSIVIEESRTSKGVDIENAEYKNNPQSFVIEKDNYITLIVNKNGIIIEIIGQISKGDAVKIIDELKGIY